MNLNPSVAMKTKFLVDAWKLEFGVGTETDFLFLCMDGAPIYEILKVAEEDGADYTWLVAARYRLHEIVTDQKAFVGVYWKSVIAPIATLAGYKNPRMLLTASNTHKLHDALLVIIDPFNMMFELLDIAKDRKHGSSRLIPNRRPFWLI
jgi:hypothetical protein